MSQIPQIKNYNLWYLWFQFSIFRFQFSVYLPCKENAPVGRIRLTRIVIGLTTMTILILFP